MKRLNVIFLPHPVKVSMFNPWGMDVVKAVSRNHNMHVLDYDQPLAPQFKGMDAVIDHGGSAGTREMVGAATDARLWQPWVPGSIISTWITGKQRAFRWPTAQALSAR